VRLHLPVMSCTAARAAGYARISLPVRMDTESEILKSMDRDMIGAAAAWVPVVVGNSKEAMELYRKRAELVGEAGVDGDL
jgi:hypothetical protein